MHPSSRPSQPSLVRLRMLMVIALFLSALPLIASPSSTALAAVDTFDLGNGHDGALSVATANTIVNTYLRVTAPIAPGDISISVASTTGIAAGDLVMVLQTTGIVPEPASGNTTAVDLSNNPVGRWELARVANASGTTIDLTATLLYSYAGSVSQVIRVPEYTSVTIANGASITGKPWDGNVGGVIAFLVSGTLANNGPIDASALGFRGGSFVADTSGSTDCTGLDQAAAAGAQKGEGIASTRFGTSGTGRGNVANGAGAGICLGSGGGGGGNGGAGGQGGNSNDGARAVGGTGGASLSYSLIDRLTLGGGGGAGHTIDSGGGSGGAGGGAIFIRANQLAGGHPIWASGGMGGSASGDNGAGGGGAGGTIAVRIATSADCNALIAMGGGGGSNNGSSIAGPGGGGAGGRVLFQAASGTSSCMSIVSAGYNGSKGGPGNPAYGAQPGQDGVATTISNGFRTPTVPTIATPANGSTTNNRRPTISGSADANTTIILYLDGAELGRPTSDAAGNFSYQVGYDLSVGSHQLAAAALSQGVQSATSAASSFTIDTTAPAKPVITSPEDNTTIYELHFKGFAEPNSIVKITITDSASISTMVDAAGAWETALPIGVVSAGAHEVKAYATDQAGNIGPSSAGVPFTYTLGQSPIITSSDLESATYGAPYEHQFSVEGVPTATLQLTQGTLPPGLTLSGTTISGIPTAAGAYGPITLTASNGYGADASYSFNLGVSQVSLTVAVNDASRTYGAPDPDFSATYTGFLDGDSIETSVTGAPSCASTATAASGVGNYDITCSTGTLYSANYSFSFAPGNLRITPATLTAKADDQAHAVGAPNPVFSIGYSGLVNGDPVASIVSTSPTCTTIADSTSAAGIYPIACSGGELASANYELVLQEGTLTITSKPAAGGIRYVRASASGANDGTSWADAYTSLQTALAAAISGEEIWVASGRYTPSASGDREASFALQSGVAIYGGFASTETLRSQRNWASNVTILSGDLDGDDGANFANNDENSYRVVTGASGATLDGFTISGGNANGTDSFGDGGGVNIASTNPALANLLVTDNSGGEGGGLYAAGASAKLTNVTFSGNRATEYGGGVFILDSSVTLENVNITGNTSATDGGGIHNATSTLTMTGGLVSANTANRNGGGLNIAYQSTATLSDMTIANNLSMANGGGMYSNKSVMVLANVAVRENTAQYSGAGIANASTGSMRISESTISDNSAAQSGGIASTGQLTLIDSTVQGNSAQYTAGGIGNLGKGTMSISGSTISGNSGTYGGGVYNLAQLSVTDSTLNGNTATGGGGGIDSSGTLTVTGSLLRDNIASDGGTAGSGGGLQMGRGAAVIVNTTFTGNQASGVKDDGGGGIMVYTATLQLTNVTIAGNSSASDGSTGNGGGGISSGSGAGITLTNTIVAGNTSAAGAPDLKGHLVSGGNNLIGDATGSSGITRGVNGDLANSAASPLDPQLAALADNGGPTFTRALLAGSPAIDAGNAGACPATDQRGNARVGTCDIGAYEFESSAPKVYYIFVPLIQR